MRAFLFCLGLLGHGQVAQTRDQLTPVEQQVQRSLKLWVLISCAYLNVAEEFVYVLLTNILGCKHVCRINFIILVVPVTKMTYAGT